MNRIIIFWCSVLASVTPVEAGTPASGYFLPNNTQDNLGFAVDIARAVFVALALVAWPGVISNTRTK